MDLFDREPQPNITGKVISIAEPKDGGKEKLVFVKEGEAKETLALPTDSNIRLETGKSYNFILEGRHPQAPIIVAAIPSPDRDVYVGSADPLASQINAGIS